MREHIAIAVDGPSGSGKSTLAKKLAGHFGYVYIDTGALYRAIGLNLIRRGIASDDTQAIIASLEGLSVTLGFVAGKSVPILNGEDVSSLIRNPEVSRYASDCSSVPEVRAFLLALQKDIAARENVVMDGRDIGTVIIPDAQVKIFLTARDGARAKRRYEELKAKGSAATLEEIEKQLVQRDANDKGREIAPAIPAEDAVLLDNSELDIEQTFDAALRIIDSGMGK